MKVTKISELYQKSQGLFRRGSAGDLYMTAAKRDQVRKDNLNKSRGASANTYLYWGGNDARLSLGCTAAGVKMVLHRYLVSDPDTDYIGVSLPDITSIPCALGRKSIAGNDQAELRVYSAADIASGNFIPEIPFMYDQYGNKKYKSSAIHGAGFVVSFSKAGRVKVYGILEDDGVVTKTKPLCLFDRIVTAGVKYMIYTPFRRYHLAAEGAGATGTNGSMFITGAYA